MTREMPAVLTVLLLPIWVLISLSACTSEEDGPTQSGLRAGLPTLPVPRVPVTPDFATNATIARYAQGAVIGQFNRVRLSSHTISAVHSSLNGTGWERVGNCRIRALGQPADTVCTWVLTACEQGSGFDWSESADGPCIPEQEPFSRWVRFSGFSSGDGSSGSGETYQSGSTLVEEAWTWDQAPDGDATVWSFYKGRPSASNLEGTLRWNRTDPGLHSGEFEWDEGLRWQAEVAADGTAGILQLQERDRNSGTWRLREEIRWEPAHGSWNFYDASGERVEERIW